MVTEDNLDSVSRYFLDTQPPGTTGLGRRLNPDAFYIACRWDYKLTPKTALISSLAKATNITEGHQDYGKSVMAKPLDWGPAVSTGRVVDLSPGVARFLGLQTDDEVEIRFLGDPDG